MNSIKDQFTDNEAISEKQFNANSVDVYDAETRANIDLQVSTAKKYPRNIRVVMQNILFYATQNIDDAQDCFYSIVKDGKIIRGSTIRLAEIIASCYGNLRASSKVLSNDGKTITAQGICWDLENNVAYCIEVKQSVTDNSGNTLPEDLQMIVINKACSIAIRNAIFKCVPLTFTSRIQNDIKIFAFGDKTGFISNRNEIIEYFTKQGVSVKDLLSLFNKTDINDLSVEDIFDLRGLQTAIKHGYTTISSMFHVSVKKTALSRATKKLIIPLEEDNNNEKLDFFKQ